MASGFKLYLTDPLNKKQKQKQKLGNLEAKETDNIWQSNHAPYKLDLRSPFVKNIELEHKGLDTLYSETRFFFPTDLIDTYEKYPESVMSGLAKSEVT